MFNYMRIASVLSILFLSGFISESFSQEIPTPVTARLVSDSLEINPGESIKLGVLFDIDPGWHIYWKYPGENGLPTRVNFHAPYGFKLDEINWPLPMAFEKPEGGVDYGYEKSVLLWTNIQIPSDLSESKIDEFGAKASWVSCKEICIPGRADLKYDVKTEGSALRKNEAIFAKWQRLVPNTVSAEDNPFEINANRLRIDAHTLRIELEIILNGQYKKVEFYPNPGDSRKVANLKTVEFVQGNTTNMSFDVITKTEQEISENEMSGILVYSNESGKRSAIEIDINLADN
jgi:DsbC/DsbD-like thiol-disulfide interchange protein